MKQSSVAGFKPLAGIGAITAAIALVGAFLMLAPSATAADGDVDPVTIDGCTITVPALQSIIYYADGDEIEPGQYPAAKFYSNAEFTAQLPGEEPADFGPWEIDVPADCLVDVTAECDNTVTFTKAGAFDWGTLSVEWSREDGVDHGTHDFTEADTVTGAVSGFPVYYEVTESEMERQVSGTIEAPECGTSDPEPEPVTPTKAPASGL